MTTVSITNLRTQIRKLADRVCHHAERICVQRNGEPAFAMVSIEDLQALEALEDRIDLEDVLKSLAEPGSIGLEDFKKKLGL